MSDSTIIPEDVQAPAVAGTVGMQVMVLPHPSGRAIVITFASGSISCQPLMPLDFVEKFKAMLDNAVEKVKAGG